MWTDALQCGLPVDVIYFDFKKAFNSVPHAHLLTKLKAYGTSGRLLDWIKSFLTNRKQRVLVSGAASSWTRVLSGVPQGSVLGPLLFLIFVNDLPAIFHNFSLLFADDLKIFSVVRKNDEAQALQNDLDKLTFWTNLWQLPSNVSKCKVLRLGRANHMYTYTLDSNNL